MIAGKEVSIGGQTFTAAPLSFGTLEDMGPFIDTLSGGVKFADLGKIRGLIKASLARNHPDITDEFLRDNLDMANFKQILLDVLAASGAESAPSGE